MVTPQNEDERHACAYYDADKCERLCNRENCRAVDEMREGADATQDPLTVPTPGQMWHRLLTADPAKRLEVIERLLSNADAGIACFERAHEARINELSAECRRLRNKLDKVRRWLHDG